MLCRSAMAGSHSPMSSKPQTSSLGTMTTASGGGVVPDPLHGLDLGRRQRMELRRPVRRRAEGADQGEEQRHHRGPGEDGARERRRGILQGSAHQERQRHDAGARQEGPDRGGQELAASDAGDVDRDEQDRDPEASPSQRGDEADDRREGDDVHERGRTEAQVHEANDADHGLDAPAGADDGVRPPWPAGRRATGGHQEAATAAIARLDQPRSSRPAPREDDAGDDAEERGLRMAERRQAEQHARAHRGAPGRFPARLGHHKPGRQEREDQAGAAGQARRRPRASRSRSASARRRAWRPPPPPGSRCETRATRTRRGPGSRAPAEPSGAARWSESRTSRRASPRRAGRAGG